MRVQALGYLGINTAKLDEWRTYAGEIMGLMPTQDQEGSALFRMDDRKWRLAIHQSESESLAYLGWEVADAPSFESLIETLTTDGLVVKMESAQQAMLRGVRGLACFDDPWGYHHELYYGPAIDESPFVSPVGVSGFLTDGVGLGHLLFMCESASAWLEFYSNTLGFKVTDMFSYGDRSAIFMRTNARHHTMAFADVPAPVGFNHFMVEVPHIDDVGYALDRAQDHGVAIVNSLGRHSNDKMVSFYMQSPSGFNVEIGCMGRIIDDDHWTVTDYAGGRGDLWGHRGSFMDEMAAAKQEAKLS